MGAEGAFIRVKRPKHDHSYLQLYFTEIPSWGKRCLGLYTDTVPSDVAPGLWCSVIDLTGATRHFSGEASPAQHSITFSGLKHRLTRTSTPFIPQSLQKTFFQLCLWVSPTLQDGPCSVDLNKGASLSPTSGRTIFQKAQFACDVEARMSLWNRRPCENLVVWQCLEFQTFNLPLYFLHYLRGASKACWIQKRCWLREKREGARQARVGNLWHPFSKGG